MTHIIDILLKATKFCHIWKIILLFFLTALWKINHLFWPKKVLKGQILYTFFHKHMKQDFEYEFTGMICNLDRYYEHFLKKIRDFEEKISGGAFRGYFYPESSKWHFFQIPWPKKYTKSGIVHYSENTYIFL